MTTINSSPLPPTPIPDEVTYGSFKPKGYYTQFK